MMPTLENGERLPALAPLAIISAVRNAGSPSRRPIAMPIGASSATVETAPGPTDETAQAIRKSRTGTTRALPRGELDGAMGERLERAVGLGDGEEQRDAGEREKQRHREAGHDGVGPQSGMVDADQPGEDDRQPADVDLRRHRQRQRDDERDQ